jgi:hypothetical protein
MQVPVPNNRLVVFTLAGAVLTALVAGALAAPTQPDGRPDRPESMTTDAAPQVAGDAPTPNQEFTPAVQTQSGYEDEEHEAYEDEHEEDDEDDETNEEED